jgi:acyl carrier protein
MNRIADEMADEAIEQRVRKVVARVLGVDEPMIQPQSHFVFDLGAESVQSVQLVAALEAAFDIEMDNDAALKVKTVREAVAFIAEHLARKRSASRPAAGV